MGHGSFATVYEGKWLGAPVAVKHFHISFEFVTQHVLEVALNLFILGINFS